MTDVAEAAKPGSPVVWDENGDNISHTFERGDKAATDAAFAKAKHIVRRTYTITRVHAQFMEPRGSLGVFDKFEDRYTLYADVNYPHRVRNMLAQNVFKVPESQVRVVVNDVGGGFGTKGWQYVDHRLVLWAAKKLDRPVKWRCERSEVIMADEHGRDNVGDIELALDENGKFLGVRLNMLASVGAYIASDRHRCRTPFGQIITLTGVHHVPACHVSIDAVLSNTNPDRTPSRGPAGPRRSISGSGNASSKRRPTSAASIVSSYANGMSFSRSRCRIKSLSVLVYDSGTFAENMEMGMEVWRFRWLHCSSRGLPREGQAAWYRVGERDRTSRRAGAGICRGAVPAKAVLALLLMGTKTHGQGHETMYKQILHEKLGTAANEIRFIDGDTDRVAFRDGLERVSLHGHRRHRADHGGGKN